MTAPTTRVEYERALAQVLSGALHEAIPPDLDIEISPSHLARAVAAWLDTFATVCPREPTAHMMLRGIKALPCDLNGSIGLALKWGIAASPFAPERGGGNEQAG